jgi:Flp pilus assembly protein TadD
LKQLPITRNLHQPDAPVDPARALFMEGSRLLAAGDLPAAERSFRTAVLIAPNFAESLANLGLVLDRMGREAPAESCYRRAIALQPQRPETHLNLGVLLARARRFDEAEAEYLRAIALAPFSPVAWTNLGALHATAWRDAEAERCHRQAMILDSGYANARFNLGYVLLRQGRLEEGWRCLEARDWYGAHAARFDCPRWQGQLLHGKSILLACEAGHGDMIQFIRYAAVLKAQGAAVVGVICHPGLVELFRSIAALDEVYSITEAFRVAGWDYWCPPLSLPRWCGHNRAEDLSDALPYIEADAARIQAWAPRLPQGGGLRVGLVWKGNPRFENDAARSLPELNVLAPLAGIPGLVLVGMQKGSGEDDAAAWPGGALPNLGPQCRDFTDTAAVVAQLDLVISVDTAVAHLAGALGKPCWVLLPDHQPDWRWFCAREDSPWYPGALRLFRQRRGGDWNDVVAALTGELRQELRVRSQLPGTAESVRESRRRGG